MKTFYLIALNRPTGTGTARFAAYEMRDGELHVVWPDADCADVDERIKRMKADAKRLGMTYTERNEYPAFHFALDGYGYSKEYDIAQRLHRAFGPCEVWALRGGAPSPVGRFPDPA